jgi:hypothetical protein
MSIMSKSNAKSEAVVLFGTANAEVTVQSLRAWINANAGGDWSKVKIVKQENIVADYQKAGLKGPVPFGYNGNPVGTRALLQNHLLESKTVAEHWTWCKSGPKAGVGTVKQHTPNNPVCLLALLNGGYSPSSKTWGQAFIHLVAA